MSQIFKNFKFRDHDVIRKKDCIILYDRSGDDHLNKDIVLVKGDCIQMINNNTDRLPLSVCLIWDYKERGWKLHESCASKGMLKQ